MKNVDPPLLSTVIFFFPSFLFLCCHQFCTHLANFSYDQMRNWHMGLLSSHRRPIVWRHHKCNYQLGTFSNIKVHLLPPKKAGGFQEILATPPSGSFGYATGQWNSMQFAGILVSRWSSFLDGMSFQSPPPSKNKNGCICLFCFILPSALLFHFSFKSKRADYTNYLANFKWTTFQPISEEGSFAC